MSRPESSRGNFNSVAWTPDSQAFAFYGRLRGDEGMWMVPIDGRAPHKINVGFKPITAWRFNPETAQVVFATDSAPRREVWKMEHFLPPASAQPRSRR